MDIIGKKFGRLTVLEKVGIKNKNSIFKCKCECGNTTVVLRCSLIFGNTSSWCLAREESSKRAKERSFAEIGLTKLKENSYVEGTSLLSYNKKINKNNKTGIKGVIFRNGKYEASIGFKKRSIYLGTFKTLEEAKIARKNAEERYF